MIRLLHSADWHLGQTLMGWNRETEHARALTALVEIAAARAVDAVIVAGDVFDTQNPPARAEQLLYRTVRELRRRLPEVVIVVLAGNHDPAGRLEAPRAILTELGVHVIGTVAKADGAFDLDRHLVPLRGGEAHILALPYLGPAALPPFDRRAEEEGSPVVRAVRAFHDEVIAAARARVGAAPLIVTGHLAVAGGTESEGAERRILIGGEHAIPTDLFPADLAYVALGHLHRPQTLAGRLRYSGSLFPLSATERDYDHGVSLVEIDASGTRIEHVSVPRPVPFLRLPPRGTLALADLDATLAALMLPPDLALEDRPYVQVALRLDGPAPALKADLDRITGAHPVRFVGHTVERPAGTPAPHEAPDLEPDLAERDPADLFARAFTEKHGVEPEAAHRQAFALVREDLLARTSEEP